MNARLALLKHTIWAEVLTFHGPIVPLNDIKKALLEEAGVSEMIEIEEILFSLSVLRHKEAVEIIQQITHKPYELMPESFPDQHEGISDIKLRQAANLQKESDNIFEIMLLMIKMRCPDANISMSDFRRSVNSIDKFYKEYAESTLLEIEEIPATN